VCFSTSFKCAFEPLIIIFRALSSPLSPSKRAFEPYLLPNALSSPRFSSSAFEPSLSSSSAFEHSLSSSSAFEPSHSFECAFEPSFSFFYLGRSPITMRPLLKKKQNKTKEKQKKIYKNKWVVFQMTCFLISTSLCKVRVSIYCFQSFQDLKKKKKFFLYLLFFINLLHKAKIK
jgi:hypothetical protein